VNLRHRKLLDYYLGGTLIAFTKPLVALAGRLLRRDHDPRPRGSIVVVKMLGGGSLILAGPALLGIKRAYPEHPLVLVTTPPAAAFGALLGVFDEIHSIDDGSLGRLVRSVARSWRRTLFADTVVDLEVYSRLTSLLSLATLARNRISFYLESVFWRRNLHTHLLFFNRFSNVHHFYDQVALLLGAGPAPREACAEALLRALGKEPPAREGRRRIALGHACSELGRERMLSPAQWRVVLARHPKLAESDVFLLGGPGDRPAAEALRAECAPALPGSTWHDACGKLSLSESVALLAGCDEFVGIDSAMLHVARLLGLPTTSYWGPTDPATRLQAFPGAADAVHYRKIACSPCIHVAEEPPCGGRNLCITGLVEPERATEAPSWVIES
jgi:ADP-heptose:LPS heptosyltransferase